MGTQGPELEPPLDDHSMLVRKFGKETINYFSGSALNRLAWLRTDHAFLRSAFSSPESFVIVLKDLTPLVTTPSELACLSVQHVTPVTGSDPFALSEEERIKNYDSTVKRPLLIFLGVLEDKSVPFEYRGIKGRPWFALDLTPKEPYVEAANALVKDYSDKGNTFLQSARNLALNAVGAGIFAQARSVMDWNNRNPFCAGCGQPTLSINAGYKRACPPTDLRGSSTAVATAECPTRAGVSNLSFPRTDPTMIAAIISADGQRALVGRQKTWPPHWYSTLAGFIEPGESIEEAVRREVMEESGVRVGRVIVHSSQPWPYPASLMIGAIGQALPDGETIDLGNDPELDDAKWVPLDELREALKVGVSGLGQPAPEGYVEGGLRLPGHTAIANRLLTAVAEGYVTTVPKM